MSALFRHLTPTALNLDHTLVDRLNGRLPFKNQPHGFQTPLLVVDEASMMVLPYFLSLASIVREDGEILLAGDHRQLSPIVQHDWKNEDRPPTVMYQPFVSAYEAVRNLKYKSALADAAILDSGLSYSFRLPSQVRDLIGRLYHPDGIVLDGRPKEPGGTLEGGCWSSVWERKTGLFLVLHSERESKSSNAVEAAIIEAILQSEGYSPGDTMGVVMPHRAQRSLLSERLKGFRDTVDVIDTVERLQGGERDIIFVSATASDPAAICARAEFELSVQRANVAFSRPKKKLVVVASESLLAHIPPDTEHYEAAVLWKSLRGQCQITVGTSTICGHNVRLMTC